MTPGSGSLSTDEMGLSKEELAMGEPLLIQLLRETQATTVVHVWNDHADGCEAFIVKACLMASAMIHLFNFTVSSGLIPFAEPHQEQIWEIESLQEHLLCSERVGRSLQ